jgi:serine/threonine protein kinase
MMALSVAQMARMSRLLEEALPLDEEARRQWLQALAPEDQDLEAALQRALLPDGGDGAEAPATLREVGIDAPEAATQKPGDRVGPYQLVRELGRGGMAEVWLARRADGAFKREVALKLPALATLRKDLASRFARERDILASLEHPNIARLYDAGVSAEGLPYLAMEYVHGEPLTTWCDSHRLGIRERLKLFLQVLDAVQYAHGHHVLHRDIKPSNILVTESGQVRLLDFGVAKLLEQEEERIELTKVYGRALTPEYASPELLRGERVDAATDIYALGVLLYELLAGSRPYRLKPGASLTAIEKEVMQAQVQRPSTQVQPDTAAARAMTVGRLARRLRGDLDAIVLKALAREPQERYPSAEALADDLQRYLTGEPVEARPARPAYWLTKFVLRHRTGMAAATLAVMLLGSLSYEQIRTRAMTAQRQALAARSASELEAAAPRSAAAAAVDKSIAVLPFVDMSEKHDQEYFSDGLSEELIDRLSHTPQLKVIARTSSFSFKGKNDDVRTIASKLGVAHLLEGSVRKAGNKLRITAQLIRAADGSHLWSQTYDRNLADIFKVQDEIAGTVAQALRVALKAGTAGKRVEPNLEAHNLLLQGNFFLDRRTKQDAEKAVALYRRASLIDPNYALALVNLARARMLQAFFVWIPWMEGYEKAREALERALKIDPDLAIAHAYLGRLRWAYGFDWQAAQVEYGRARELDPNDDHGQVGLDAIDAFRSGRLDELIADFNQRVLRDPVDTGTLGELAHWLFFAGRFNEAEATCRKLEELNPKLLDLTYCALTRVMMGRNTEALVTEQKESWEPGRLWGLSIIYWKLGRRAESGAALNEMDKRYGAVMAYQSAETHAYRGEVELAFEWLERAYRERDTGLYGLRSDPFLANLRGDSRYKVLLAKMNLAD